MSWGVDIEVSHGDGYVTHIEVVSGHTYNLTPMWRKALPTIVKGSTSDLEGLVCGEIEVALGLGLLDAVHNKTAYEELDPENGWGDYEGFLKILTRLTHLCHAHPTGVLRWNG